MALVKLLPSGIDLSQNFTFTGSVSGAGGGKILQVKNVVFNTTGAATSSTSFVDINANFKIDITPSASDSKLLVWCHICGISNADSSLSAVSIQLLRDSTSIAFNENIKFGSRYPQSFTTTITALDSPSTTNQVTIKPQFRNRESNSVNINTSGGDISEMVIMEVAA